MKRDPHHRLGFVDNGGATQQRGPCASGDREAHRFTRGARFARPRRLARPRQHTHPVNDVLAAVIYYAVLNSAIGGTPIWRLVKTRWGWSAVPEES